jgi:hypothetical protein
MGILENFISSLKTDGKNKNPLQIKSTRKEENVLKELIQDKTVKECKNLILKINNPDILEELSKIPPLNTDEMLHLISNRKNILYLQKVLHASRFDENILQILDKITQEDKVIKIILEKEFGPLRERAIKKIKNEKNLVKLAKKIDSPKWGKIIIQKIENIEELEFLSQNAGHKKVKIFAKERVEDLLKNKKNDPEKQGNKKLAVLSEKIETFLKHYSETKAETFLEDFKKTFLVENDQVESGIEKEIQQKINLLEKRILQKIERESCLQKAREIIKTNEMNLREGEKITGIQSLQAQESWDEMNWTNVPLKEREELNKKFFQLIEKLTDKNLEKKIQDQDKALKKLISLLAPFQSMEKLDKSQEKDWRIIFTKWRSFEKEWDVQKKRIDIPDDLGLQKDNISNDIHNQKMFLSKISLQKNSPPTKKKELTPEELLERFNTLIKRPHHSRAKKEVYKIKDRWEFLLNTSPSLVSPFEKEFNALNETFFERQDQFQQKKDWENWSSERKRKEILNELKLYLDRDLTKGLGLKIKECLKEWKSLRDHGKNNSTEVDQEFFELVKVGQNKCLESKEKIYKNLLNLFSTEENEQITTDSSTSLTEEFINEKTGKIKTLQKEFSLIGPLPKDFGEDIVKGFQEKCQFFFNQRKLLISQRDKQKQDNYRLKKDLYEKAKELLTSESHELGNDSIKKVITLQKEWKKIGPVPSNKKDDLWNNFQNICHQFFENLDHQKKGNQEKKELLCKKMDDIVTNLNEETHFKDMAQSVKILQQEWKTTGPIPREIDETLWKKFRKNCDIFFASRDQFLQEKKDQYAQNEILKRALLGEIEELYQNKSTKEYTDKILELQKSWKEIGPAPKNVAKELWRDFKKYCDYFFEKKKEFFTVQLEEKKEHLKIKQDICIQLEALAKLSLINADLDILNNSNDVAKQIEWALRLKTEILVPGDQPKTKRRAINKVIELQKLWKSTGRVPKENEHELWEHYRNLTGLFFQNKVSTKEDIQK